ncbi:hypothetical protein H4S06_002589 [Coemansia sp. BCRC 34490]|nr:hypothetical protein H4S06_002589 [Coemansia sp. BCRC 34490]
MSTTVSLTEKSMEMPDPSDKVAAAVADQETQMPPADSLHGWLVVLGNFFILMMLVGVTNSFGVYLEVYSLHVFPDTPSSTLSWIGSLQFGMMCVFGVAAGVLVERYPSQLVVAVGGVFTGASLLIASACRSPVGLILTQGVMFGVSGSMLLIPAMSLPGQWMEKYRALGTGISIAGGSLGGLWLSFASRSMVSSIGWEWALRITGLLIVAISVCFSPLMKKRIHLARREKIIDFSALRNINFVVLFISTLLAAGGYFMPYYFMSSYAVVVLKEPSAWSANIAAILNSGSVVGRIATGLLADRIGALNALVITAFISSFAVLVVWLPFKSLGALIAAALLFGFASGSLVSLVPVVTANMFGIKRLPSIMGLIFFAYAIGTFISSPVGGVLLDKYGHGTNFSSLIIYNGVFFSTATALFIVLRMLLNTSILAKV